MGKKKQIAPEKTDAEARRVEQKHEWDRARWEGVYAYRDGKKRNSPYRGEVGRYWLEGWDAAKVEFSKD